MRIGAHLREDTDPLATAADLGIDVFQMFVTDPQSWKSPPQPAGAGIPESPIDVVVHSSYSINVASLNNRLRMPSRKAVEQQAAAAAELGAFGLVVHGGHLRDGEDSAEGFANWHKLFDRQVDKGGFGVPILIENTAGGDHAMARTSNPSTGSGARWATSSRPDSASTPATPGPAVRIWWAWSNGSRRSPAASTWCI